MSITPKTKPGVGLLVVDMQNGYCHPQGGLAKAGVDNRPQQQVVPNVRKLVRLCHGHSLPVFWSRQEHLSDDVTRRQHRIPSHMAKRDLHLCYSGTSDTEIVEDLLPEVGSGDYVFVKHRSSCFFDTTLNTAMRMRGLETLIICGVGTNYCVESTIRDAYARDYDIVVVEDCVAGSFPDLHAATLKNVSIYYGEVLSLGDFEEFLTKSLL